MKKAAVAADLPEKPRVVDISVDITPGAYVPPGTTTAGSVFDLAVTDGDATGTPETCTTTGNATGTGSTCSVIIDEAATSVTVTQTSAPSGLVVAPAQSQATGPESCGDSPFGEFCDYPPNDFTFADNGVAPTANDDSYSVDADKTTTLDVASNDDTAGAPVTSVDVTQPAHGKVTVNSTGSTPISSGTQLLVAQPVSGSFTLSYTPAAGYSGADPFQYTLTTANGSDSAQLP